MDDPDTLLLRCLLVSDIHLAVKRLAAIATWAQEAEPRYERSRRPSTVRCCQHANMRHTRARRAHLPFACTQTGATALYECLDAAAASCLCSHISMAVPGLRTASTL